MDTEKVSAKRKNEAKFTSKNHYTNNVTVRIQRNQAEKQRRDRLNDQIAQLATLVPTAVNATKPLDKVSILRLSASWMRLNYSCLNAKRFKSAVANYLDLHHSLVTNLDILEKSINGFIIATTFSGIVLMCSRYSEEYIGYQNIDLLGHHISNFVLPKEKDLLFKKMRNLISKYNNGSSNPRNVIRVRMQQRPLPRSNEMRYRKMSFSLSIHSGGEAPDNAPSLKKSIQIGRRKDFGESAVILIFAEPVQLEPDIDVQYLEQKDCYFTLHGTQGEIIFADHRISTITGYMPREVLGNSAYQYIHSSDVPIALFAQKAMFASSDGTGIITYRLRIRDTSFVYLQTKGQIRYKDCTKEVRQFICCNILLSEEDGSRELKKFHGRYAPQLDASNLKLKENKVHTDSPTEANVDSYAARKNYSKHENLKHKGCLTPVNDSTAGAPMEMEEPDKVAECSKNNILFLDLDKVNKSRSHSLSSNSDIGSTDNSPKSFVANTFEGGSQAYQTMNNKDILLPETFNCNVQNKFSTFSPVSPLHSMSSSNDASISSVKPVIHENNHLSTPEMSVNSTFLSSDLLLIPDDFTPYETANEKTFLASEELPSSKDNGMFGNIQRNLGNFTFTNNIDMDPVNFLVPQDAFQNHETASHKSLIIPDETSICENGHGSVVNYVSHFSTFSPKIGSYMDHNRSDLNTREISAANQSISMNGSQSNIDLSFLDQSVDKMALLSDLSDFYENSMSFLRANHSNQYRMENAISISPDAETHFMHDSSVLNNTNGANAYETNVLELCTPMSLNSHISSNDHSPQQFNDCSSNLYFNSDSEDSMRTNGTRTFNADFSPMEHEWQMRKSSKHCSSTKQKINGHIYRQLQTSAEINNIDRAGHKASSMNSQPDFSNQAQNEGVIIDDLVNLSSTSISPSHDESKFKLLSKS